MSSSQAMMAASRTMRQGKAWFQHLINAPHRPTAAATVTATAELTQKAVKSATVNPFPIGVPSLPERLGSALEYQPTRNLIYSQTISESPVRSQFGVGQALVEARGSDDDDSDGYFDDPDMDDYRDYSDDDEGDYSRRNDRVWK